MPAVTPAAAVAGGSAAAATTGNDSSSTLHDLLAWLQSVGIWWDEQLVQIRAGCSGCSGPALGVFAVSDISENQLLCMIPRSAILSPRTSKLAGLLEAERLGGGLALTIAVMYEASLGGDSRWAGYLSSLPRREYLPLFWSDAELQLLQGTSLEASTGADRQDTEDDYETHVLPLMQKYPQAFPHPELCGLDQFRVAASWVASRCFYVDNWHGDAMLPLADIFNHKASVVLLGDAWGVAELCQTQPNNSRQRHSHQQHQQQQHGSEGDASSGDADSGDEGGSSGSGHEHEHDHEHADSGEEHGHEHDHEHGSSSEEQQDSEEQQGSEEGDDDAQHGFAVGGMPMIAAALPAAAAAAGGGGGDGSAAEGSAAAAAAAAGRWVRDGVNLRLEIGICSMGPPDSSSDLPATAADPTSAAAAAGAGTGEGEDAASADQHAAKRRRVQATQQQQQQQHKSDQQAAAEKSDQQGARSWPEKRLEIVAASAVAAGAEVHNTYGELGNAQLVKKYGFCLPHNPFDEVTLCDNWTAFVFDVCIDSSGAPVALKLRQHMDWLMRHSNLLDDDDATAAAASGDEPEQQESDNEAEAAEPPTIAPGGRLSLMTAAVVRLLGASPAQLQQWQGLEDVVQHPDNEGSDSDTAPNAVPLEVPGAGEAAEAAAADKGGEADAVVAQHFEDVRLSDRSISWWGRAGLELLAAAVQRRLQHYPASLADDRLAQQQQQQQEEGEGGGESAAEHATAVAAALQLRVCEQEALIEVLKQVQELLASEA